MQYGSLDHFMLAWIILLDSPLYMGMAMIKGAQKYVGMWYISFSMVHKSGAAGQYISWRGQER